MLSPVQSDVAIDGSTVSNSDATFKHVHHEISSNGRGRSEASSVRDGRGSRNTGQTIGLGDAVSSILQEKEIHRYNIELEGRQSYIFDVIDEPGSDKHIVTILDEDGNVLISKTLWSDFEFIPPEDGNYLITVEADFGIFSFIEESYNFAIKERPDPSKPVGSLDEIADYIVHEDPANPIAGVVIPSSDENQIYVEISEDFTAQAREMIEYALRSWERVVGVQFEILHSRSNRVPAIEIKPGDGSDAYTKFEYVMSRDGSIFIDENGNYVIRQSTIVIPQRTLDNALDDPEDNVYDLISLLIHEIGHGLGLYHPGDYNESAQYGVDNEFSNDSYAVSVMSYFDQGVAGFGTDLDAMTPQMADILAGQQYNRAPDETFGGDTIYFWNSNAEDLFDARNWIYGPVALTIYDTGGEDTINASGWSDDQVIDLRDTYFSSLAGAINNIGIAAGVNIENAIGGRGDDILVGNRLDNELSGGGGSDVLYGRGGSDKYTGGKGRDIFYFDATSRSGDINVITDFNANRDVIVINGWDQIKDGVEITKRRDGSVVIKLQDGSRIIVEGYYSRDIVRYIRDVTEADLDILDLNNWPFKGAQDSVR